MLIAERENMREITIELEDVSLFARHGVFEFERKNGNDFIVNLCVKYMVTSEAMENDNIEDTICYASLYDIVKEEMAVTRNTLESFARSIAEKISLKYRQAGFISCKITKSVPPIPEFNGMASVTYTIDRR